MFLMHSSIHFGLNLYTIPVKIFKSKLCEVKREKIICVRERERRDGWLQNKFSCPSAVTVFCKTGTTDVSGVVHELLLTADVNTRRLTRTCTEDERSQNA
jgi:hypothetical protein